MGGPARPRRAGRGRLVPAEAVADSRFDPGTPPRAGAGAGERARPGGGRRLERGADAAGGLRRRARSRRRCRRRAGGVALARRARACGADRPRRLLGRAPAGNLRRRMAYEFKLPDLGEGLTEGEIARWLVAVGDEIAEDAPLVEIQTDKTTVEIPSPAAGTVLRDPRRRGRGRPGRLRARRDRQRGRRGRHGGAAHARACPRSWLQRPRPDASRRRRSSAGSPQELGVDLDAVTATGPGGRITEEDVRAAPRQPTEGRREKVRGVRRQIVEHLTRAHREVPAVTYVEECDFTDVDLKLLLPTVLHATAPFAARLPRAERAARRRRDRLPRPLRPRHRRPDRPGARRPGRPRLRHAQRRGAARRTSTSSRRRLARASLRPRSCAARPSRSRAPASSPACS